MKERERDGQRDCRGTDKEGEKERGEQIKIKKEYRAMIKRERERKSQIFVLFFICTSEIATVYFFFYRRNRCNEKKPD